MLLYGSSCTSKVEECIDLSEWNQNQHFPDVFFHFKHRQVWKRLDSIKEKSMWAYLWLHTPNLLSPVSSLCIHGVKNSCGTRLDAWGKNRSGQEIQEMMKKLMSSVMKLHAIGVAHRDLKYSNIVILGSGTASTPRFIDFGSATYLYSQSILNQDEQKCLETKICKDRTQIVGTPCYSCPTSLPSVSSSLSWMHHDYRTADYWGWGIAYIILMFPLVEDHLPSGDEQQALVDGLTTWMDWWTLLSWTIPIDDSSVQEWSRELKSDATLTQTINSIACQKKLTGCERCGKTIDECVVTKIEEFLNQEQNKLVRECLRWHPRLRARGVQNLTLHLHDGNEKAKFNGSGDSFFPMSCRNHLVFNHEDEGGLRKQLNCMLIDFEASKSKAAILAKRQRWLRWSKDLKTSLGEEAWFLTCGICDSMLLDSWRAKGTRTPYIDQKRYSSLFLASFLIANSIVSSECPFPEASVEEVAGQEEIPIEAIVEDVLEIQRVFFCNVWALTVPNQWLRDTSVPLFRTCSQTNPPEAELVDQQKQVEANIVQLISTICSCNAFVLHDAVNNRQTVTFIAR